MVFDPSRFSEDAWRGSTEALKCVFLQKSLLPFLNIYGFYDDIYTYICTTSSMIAIFSRQPPAEEEPIPEDDVSDAESEEFDIDIGELSSFMSSLGSVPGTSMKPEDITTLIPALLRSVCTWWSC